MIKNHILSSIFYIESSIALYFSYIYFLDLINNLLYSSINYGLLFILSISLLSFLITFYLGTYFSREIKNKSFLFNYWNYILFYWSFIV